LDVAHPLAQRLIARCVDVRKHIDKAVGSYVLPEFKDYLKMKQGLRILNKLDAHVSSFIYTNFASNELCTIATL
jgi:hypothetical protein